MAKALVSFRFCIDLVQVEILIACNDREMRLNSKDASDYRLLFDGMPASARIAP